MLYEVITPCHQTMTHLVALRVDPEHLGRVLPHGGALEVHPPAGVDAARDHERRRAAGAGIELADGHRHAPPEAAVGREDRNNFV